ncbi:MAG: efflux RND transporter periplasmic adaptor subunit [Anaerolineales bacterium]|nr:efflux RND transporter periplasmic adaptor subunit [Anaerolineales bacterium]
MSQTKNSGGKSARKRWLIGAGLAAMVIVAGALLLPRVLQPRAAGAQPAQTAEVTAITAISRVESSGTVQARQLASLAWKTTGQVLRVNVQVGDRVKAGDVLMELDPLTAPANVLSAQAELINAQAALDNLLNPKATDIANAEKAVANAQQQVEKAERALRNLLAPDLAYYQEQVNRAQQDLKAAQQNAEITNFQTSLRNAKDALDNAASNLKKYQDLEAQYPGYSQLNGNVLENAQKAYDRAVQDYQAALYNFEQAQARNANAIADAQKSLNTAHANLEAAQRGPDALTRAQAEADLAVARARLADAQAALNRLRNGADPDDIAAARARVQAAQATVDQLVIKAPFDGEVLAVNYQPGDVVVQSQAAVVLADRSQLYVDVKVDETEVASIEIGDAVTLTLDSLAGQEFAGNVEYVNPVGETLSGLVKYTVRAGFQPVADTTIFLGATANVTIVTAVQANALAVPLEAIQSDDEGEYVTRLDADGTRTRVSVRSGSLQGDLVTVSGGLQVGDRVLIATADPDLPGGRVFIGGGQQP